MALQLTSARLRRQYSLPGSIQSLRLSNCMRSTLFSVFQFPLRFENQGIQEGCDSNLSQSHQLQEIHDQKTWPGSLRINVVNEVARKMTQKRFPKSRPVIGSEGLLE